MTGSDLVEFSNNAAFWPLHRSFRRAMRERASRVGAVEVLTAEANSRLGRSAGPPEPGSSKPPQTPAGPKKIIGAATAAEVSATSQFESFAVVGEMLRMSRRLFGKPEEHVPAVDDSLLHALGVALELARARGDQCATRLDVRVALVAETDALRSGLVAEDMLAKWMTISREWMEVPWAPATSSLEKYGFVRLPRLLEIMSWPERRSADRKMGIKGARAVAVMQLEAIRQAVRAGDSVVGLEHFLLAVASVGHQVRSRIAWPRKDRYWVAGLEPDRIWMSDTHLRDAGLAYDDTVRRLASKRVEDDSLTSSGGRELYPTYSAEVVELCKELPALVAKGSGDSELVPALVTVAPQRVAEVVAQLGGDPEPLLVLRR